MTKQKNQSTFYTIYLNSFPKETNNFRFDYSSNPYNFHLSVYCRIGCYYNIKGAIIHILAIVKHCREKIVKEHNKMVSEEEVVITGKFY